MKMPEPAQNSQPSKQAPRVDVANREQAAIKTCAGVAMILTTAGLGLLTAGLLFLTLLSPFVKAPPQSRSAPVDWLRDVAVTLIAAAVATVVQFVVRAKEENLAILIGGEAIFAMLLVSVAFATGPFDLPVKYVALCAASFHVLCGVVAYLGLRR